MLANLGASQAGRRRQERPAWRRGASPASHDPRKQLGAHFLHQHPRARKGKRGNMKEHEMLSRHGRQIQSQPEVRRSCHCMDFTKDLVRRSCSLTSFTSERAGQVQADSKDPKQGRQKSGQRGDRVSRPALLWRQTSVNPPW